MKLTLLQILSRRLSTFLLSHKNYQCTVSHHSLKNVIYINQTMSVAVYHSILLIQYSGSVVYYSSNIHILSCAACHHSTHVGQTVYGEEKPSEKLLSLVNANKIRLCKLARECLDKNAHEYFKNFFTLQEHTKHKGSNRCTHSTTQY